MDAAEALSFPTHSRVQGLGCRVQGLGFIGFRATVNLRLTKGPLMEAIWGLSEPLVV